MSELFLKAMNMSISASWLILAVLICRLVLKKAPKWVYVLLWGIVAARLLFPFSIESDLSLIPSAETISPEIMMDATPAIHTGIPAINNAVNPIISQSFAPSPEASANPLQIWIPVLAVVWIVGAVVLLAYTAISFWLLRKKVDTAILFRDNIFQSENVGSPFVLGIIRPKIYLPFKMDGQDMDHVVAHELAHIRRRDHWWKPLGFLLLAVHWFNPLMWLAYVLLCRDIELACDEKVIKELDHEQRADYTQALLTCSVNRRMIAACPLAFGEVGVKERVKSVMNYRKPAFWIVVLAVAACGVVAVCFLTDPKSIDAQLAVFIDCEIANHHQSAQSAENFCCLDWEVLGTKKNGNQTAVYMWVLYMEYSYDNGLKEEAGAHVPTVITVEKDGNYRLAEYWEPRDGSYYAGDIRDKFPWYLHLAALDPQRYIDRQLAACEKMAREHFNAASYTEMSNAGAAATLSLNDVIALSQKGHNLSWADFENFDHVDTGSGLYIWKFEINELFTLLIGGSSTDTKIKPMYINLIANDGTDSYIDIRDGGVTGFIDLHKDNPVVFKCGAAWQCSPVGRSEEMFSKMLALNGFSERFAMNSIQYLPVVRINSTEELQAVKEILSPYADLDHSAYPDAPAFTAAAEAYDDGFFASSTLFLVYTEEPTTAVRHSVEYVLLSNRILSIGIERLDPGAGDTMMEGWLIAVAVSTDLIANADEIEARISSTAYVDRQFLSDTEIIDFSYNEDLNSIRDSYPGIAKEDYPGVKFAGFINDSETEIGGVEDAVERAKRECTIKYDTVIPYYDSSMSIWKIVFCLSDTLGGDQAVFLNEKGITVLVVYGE